MKVRHPWLVVPLLVAVLSVTACNRQEEPSAEAPQPAKIEAVDGGGDVHKVTLTDDAMRQVGIRSEQVKAAAAPSTLTVIPVTAVIYDPQGNSWTYTTVGATSFVRKAIVIDHIAGTNAFLRSGPAVGTPVVTVGASELLGAEYGVGEE